MRLPAFATVTAFLDASRRADLESAVSHLDEHVEVFPSPHWVPPGTMYRGRSGWRSFVEFMGAGSAAFRFDVELRALGDHVIAVGTGWREGPAGNRDVRGLVWLFAVRSGAITRIEWFPNEEAAQDSLHRASEQERGDAFDAAPTPLVLLDDQGCIVHVNRAMAELVGLPQEQFPERRVEDFLESLEGTRFGRPAANGDRLERMLVSADGTKRLVEIRVGRGYLPGRHVLVVVPRRPGAQPPRLTGREREIFELLALGLTGPEVATRLRISVNTVRTHVANGMETLGAKTRAHAVAEALARGELDFEQLPALVDSLSPELTPPGD